MRIVLAALLAAVVAGVAPAPSFAQDEAYPNRSVRLIYGPASDAALRVVADRLQKRLGQPFVVEARPGGGGGGEIAVKAVSGAPADGYTLLFATITQTLATALQVANYDIVNDFSPVAMVNLSSFLLVVHPSLPAKNLKELIALAREKPGTLNCAYSGRGTPQHLACQMFAKLAGVEVVLVPYRDAASMANALLANQIHILFSVASAVAGQVDAGGVRALATTGLQRTPLYPDVPTMAEAGLSGFELSGWGSLLAPAKTPPTILAKLNGAVVAAMKEPDVVERFKAIRLDLPPPLDPPGVAAFIRDDIARWNRIIDVAGVPRGQ